MFEWQIKIYQQQMKILDEEEKICQTKMESIKKNLKSIDFTVVNCLNLFSEFEVFYLNYFQYLF